MLKTKPNWNTFFNNLGRHLKNENILSDITEAVCRTNIDFQIKFLSFFFGNNLEFEKPINLIREYPRGDSRPDFFFKIDDQEFIIEVKIYDRNQHFNQYVKTFPNAERGYITNYFLEEQDGYKVKTWEGFYNEIKGNDDEMIKAYASYLKKICHIVEIEKMNLSNLKSLRDLIIVFQKIIEENSKLTLGKSKHNDGSAGKEFNFFVDNQLIQGWFGTVYHMNTILVYLYSNNLPKINFRQEDFSAYPSIEDTPWYQENGIYFMINLDRFETNFSNNNTSLETQKELLSEFLNDVVKYFTTKI